MDEEKVVYADMSIKTEVPIVFLDNFIEIIDIKSKGDLELVFVSEAECVKAFEKWFNHPELHFMVGHKWAADKNTTSVFKPFGINRDRSILVIKTQMVDPSSVIKDYDIVLTQYDINSTSNNQLNKRGIFHQDVDRTWAFPLNLNFDSEKNSVIKNEISLFEGPRASVTCHDCFIRGEANVRIHLKGTFYIINHYEINFYGRYKGNVDVFMKTDYIAPDMQTQKILQSVDLYPVFVPDIFSFDPLLMFSIGVYYGSLEDLNLKFGVDVDIPFNYKIESDSLFQAPKIIHDHSFNINNHPLTMEKIVNFEGSVHLIPSIDFSFKLFGFKLDLELAIDSSLGTEIVSGDEAECDELYYKKKFVNDNEISLDLRSLPANHKYTIYKTEKKEIKCKDCDICIPYKSPLNALDYAKNSQAALPTITYSLMQTTDATLSPTDSTTTSKSFGSESYRTTTKEIIFETLIRSGATITAQIHSSSQTKSSETLFSTISEPTGNIVLPTDPVLFIDDSEEINSNIKNVVVLIMENRSFDNILGRLKKDGINKHVDGLTGNEYQISSNGTKIMIQNHKIDNPKNSIDPGHDLQDVTQQIYGSRGPSRHKKPRMSGFAVNAEEEVKVGYDFNRGKNPDVSMLEAMTMVGPDLLPVTYKLAQEYSISDEWFSSVPAATQVNRHFLYCGTSFGQTKNDMRPIFPIRGRTIWDNLDDNNITWKVYSDNILPSTLLYASMRKAKNMAKTVAFPEFLKDARDGKLPQYSMIDPDFLKNDNHPPNSFHEGEKFVKTIYESLRASPQWNDTLFVIIYDEHGIYLY